MSSVKLKLLRKHLSKRYRNWLIKRSITKSCRSAGRYRSLASKNVVTLKICAINYAKAVTRLTLNTGWMLSLK